MNQLSKCLTNPILIFSAKNLSIVIFQGFCCVQYQVCTDTDSFSLDNRLDVEADYVAQDEETCKGKDYIIIEGILNTFIFQYFDTLEY